MARKRNSSLQRKVGNRSPKKRVVAVCEGSKTEPQYLKLINMNSRDALIELVIIDEPATSPKQLVERACAEMKKSKRELRKTQDPNTKIEEIWCVYDVDQHPLHAEARQQANDNNILVAVSNPSIEIWFLLHFARHTAHIHRRDAAREVAKFIPEYDKNITELTELKGRYQIAKERAQKLQEKHDGDGTRFPENNPSSNVWQLVESLNAEY